MTPDNMILVAGTKDSSYQKHNRVSLLNQDLKHISRAFFSKGGGLEYIPSNPIQTLKCTQKKNVNYVIACCVYNQIHLMVIINKELRVLIKTQKLTSGSRA